ncbi:MAG: alanine dehydrogenase [Defluviitaleaceae bacterium]|nr:alanine dehydrogenase [Defluviitaleaceae bacterium]MCL2274623.1 alanine dehydrogenase [Defluviitaleaceae bacterium]
MRIGTVTEVKQNEYRVGLTPGSVMSYVQHGHQVYVQTGAGAGSGFLDEEYQRAGATLVVGAKEVWETCDMIVKVKEPLAEEFQYFREGQIIYTYLHLAAEKDLTDALLAKKTKAVAYETITDDHGGLPLLRPMSEIAGKLSVQAGAHCLEKPMGGRGVLLGGSVGVTKGDVVILGGGVVGTAAMKMAVGLGASVTILDTNIDRLTYLDDVFQNQIQTMYSSPAAIEKAIKHADLVIGAVLIPGGAAPKLVKRDHLKTMREGAVIVDVAVDQGGCCETTRRTYHNDPTYVIDGIIHYGVANMPGAVSRTSTFALTNATLSPGLKIANMGLEAAARADMNIANGVNCYNGHLTYEEVAHAFGMGYTNVREVLG